MFSINGIRWSLIIVPQDSHYLKCDDGSMTVGMTDRETQTVYIASYLFPTFQWKVLCHEIVHAAMFSYNVYLTIEQEEIVADIIATYGREIINMADMIFSRLNRRAV